MLVRNYDRLIIPFLKQDIYIGIFLIGDDWITLKVNIDLLIRINKVPKYTVRSFFRLKELIKVKKEKAFSCRYVFLKNAKNLGRSDNGKQRKKGIVLEVKTLT